MGQTRKEWLQTVTAQLRCRRAVPGVERELENHLSEQYNAFVAQGCAPEEAEHRTVESMGDPVLAGGALDRVHRPRPAWGPFFMVAALLLAGALLRFFWSVPVSAQGVYLWREGAYQSLAAALAGIAVLAAVYFCMDVSLLARWTKALYIGLAAVSAYGFLAGYTLMNGRRLWTVWGVSYDATHFSMIFIPIYAAVVYRQRGRGWAGLLVSGFAIVPGLWLCIMVPHLAAACVLGLAGLAVCLVCCAGDWYGLGGKKSFAVVLGVTAGSLVVTFLLVLLLMPGLAGSLQRHLEVLLAPDANAAGAGYWMNALRRMWDGMRWLGPGDGSLPLGEKAALGTVGEFAGKAVRELRADYLLAYAGWRYGIACAAALAAAVAGALAWLWRTALRTRSSIGRLCAVGCCALLTMHGVLNLLSCLGWSSARGDAALFRRRLDGCNAGGACRAFALGLPAGRRAARAAGNVRAQSARPSGSRRPLCVQRRHAAHPASVNGKVFLRAVPGPQPSG